MTDQQDNASVGPSSARQMALDFRRDSTFAAARFIADASNASARAWLTREHWPDRRLWLWGPPGTGKTHLLRIWARRHQAVRLDGVSLSPALLAQLRGASDLNGNIAIDNVDSLSDEVAMLHLLNEAQSHGARVLMVGRAPPSRQDFALPDLASRLRATAAVCTYEPEDRLRVTLLLSLLAERQLVVPQPVTDWLCRHLPRTGGALVTAVERLDAAALARGAPITRVLAGEVLADLLQPGAEEEDHD